MGMGAEPAREIAHESADIDALSAGQFENGFVNAAALDDLEAADEGNFLADLLMSCKL